MNVKSEMSKFASEYMHKTGIQIARKGDVMVYNSRLRVLTVPYIDDISALECLWCVLLDKGHPRRAFGTLVALLLDKYTLGQQWLNLVVYAWVYTYGSWLHLQEYGSVPVDMKAFEKAVSEQKLEHASEALKKGPF